MTLFEKIYWTCLIVNIVLYCIGWLNDEFGDVFDLDLKWLKVFLILQFFLTFCYWAVKLILWIWGIHISLFPSIK